jgi:ElaB/YqjD/DUF883 family membrane-anchored ribosome-binding protein
MAARKRGKKNLNEHVKELVQDSEELLEAAAGQGGEKLAHLRARFHKNVHQLQDRIDTVGDLVMDKAGDAAESTDQLIRRRPWQSLAVAAGVGLLLGMLAGRH